MGNPAEAEAIVEHGLELDPGSRTGKLALTETLLHPNLTVAAKKSALNLIRQRPDSGPAHIMLGEHFGVG
jgi:hypothetical protein